MAISLGQGSSVWKTGRPISEGLLHGEPGLNLAAQKSTDSRLERRVDPVMISCDGMFKLKVSPMWLDLP